MWSPATAQGLDRNDSGKTVYGDTLWAIAKKNGCTMAEIVRLNGIKDPSNVTVGTGWKYHRSK